MGKKNEIDNCFRKGRPCFIIAEAGSNHNGSLEQAKRMIKVASDAGADAVKFQIFRAKTMYPDKPIGVKYLKNIGINESLYNIIKKSEVPYGWIKKLYEHCRRYDIEFMASPFDAEAVHALKPYVNVFKIASYESLDVDLINEVKKTGKLLFISTGGCKEEEIDLLVRSALGDYKDRTVLLHCIARYPAPLSRLHLKVIPYLSEKYGIAVGYSDHSQEPCIAPVVAVALGACLIEKHFTLNKKLPGPDHAFAVEPHELKAMVDAIRMAEKTVVGGARRDLFNCEKELYRYKRCLYCKTDLQRGARIRGKDLLVLRNTGLVGDYVNPLERDTVIGRALRRSKKAKDILMKGDIQ